MKEIIFITIKTLLSILFFVEGLSAQHLDVEGHSKVRGNLDMNHMSDTTTINIGRNAGTNTLYSDRRSNTFLGSYAGNKNTSGEHNSYFGREAGRSNLAGNFNSCYGTFSGSANTGSYNCFFGGSSGFLTQGHRNCFFGAYSGLLNSTGSDNAFFGFESGYHNEGGDNNVAIGNRAAFNNKSGFQNISIGNEALYNSTEDYNIAVGTQSLYNTILGQNNTALGGFAGYSNDNVNSTFIGYGAGSTVGVTNGTALGYDAQVNDNNKVRIGNGSVTVIEGNVAFSPMSDRRLKENIKTVDLGLQFIRELNPVVYHRIGNERQDLEMGLIAQEIDSVLMKYDDGNIAMINQGADGFLSVRYNDLFAPLIKAIQEQQGEIEQLRETIKSEEENLSMLRKSQSTLKDEVKTLRKTLKATAMD